MRRRTLAWIAIAVATVACGKSSGGAKAGPSDAPAPHANVAPALAVDASAKPDVEKTRDEALAATKPDKELSCKRQPFASKIPIAEASGATWMEDDTLLVIGDSGTNGAFLRLHSGDGSVLSKGALPLDSSASDDLEGLSRIGSTVYAITSSGFMREWKPSGDAFELVRKSYSVAPKGDTKHACASARDSNCGPNYEGLCLLEDASETTPNDKAPCVGFAASKARGELVCLTQDAKGRLAVRPQHTIPVAAPKTLSGCHFDADGKLWFGNNVFAANSVGFVEGYQAPKSATITRLGALGLGFAEAIALGPDGQVVRFSDTTGSPSLLDKYICR